MASDKDLPAALRRHMNQDEEIVAITAWAETTDKETLDGTLPKSAPYDKQRSRFVVTKPNVYVCVLQLLLSDII